MKIKALTRMAGPGLSAAPGEEIEVSEAQGAALIAGGYAVEVRTAPPPQAAVREPAETEDVAAPEQATAGPEEQSRRGRGRPPRAR